MAHFQSPTEQLLVDLQDKFAVITLNRPEARNALSNELTGALRAAIAWAGISAEKRRAASPGFAAITMITCATISPKPSSAISRWK